MLAESESKVDKYVWAEESVSKLANNMPGMRVTCMKDLGDTVMFPLFVLSIFLPGSESSQGLFSFLILFSSFCPPHSISKFCLNEMWPCS